MYCDVIDTFIIYIYICVFFVSDLPGTRIIFIKSGPDCTHRHIVTPRAHAPNTSLCGMCSRHPRTPPDSVVLLDRVQRQPHRRIETAPPRQLHATRLIRSSYRFPVFFASRTFFTHSFWFFCPSPPSRERPVNVALNDFTGWRGWVGEGLLIS